MNYIKNGVSQANLFLNIVGNYRLRPIFQNIQERLILKIIKYNKKLQNKLNLGIKDYKDYQKIVIEIIPVKNKIGKFINIDNKDNENFYHIYFNDDSKETKQTYINKDDQINKIKIIIDYEIKNLNKLFFECRCIERVNFIRCNRKDFTDMEDMFHNCESLKELNFNKNFNTDKVINMNGLIYRCSSLIKLNLNNFNTDNVTDMKYMFYRCYSLKELCVNNFRTNYDTEVRFMFTGCSRELQKEIENSNKNIKPDAFCWF